MLNSEDAVDAEKVRAYTEERVHSAAHAEGPVLIEAPPTSGKSKASRTLVDTTDTPITYLAGRTDLYNKAESWAEDQPDINSQTIPSPYRCCDTFKGENDGEEAKAKQLYSKGVPGPKIHSNNDVHTPCVDGDSSCDYLNERLKVISGLENGRIDFLIGNHLHAHNSMYIEDRIVVFDEFNKDPFLEQFPSDDDLAASDHPGDLVSHFLREVDGKDDSFPTDVYEDVTDILQKRDDEGPLNAALDWFEDHGASMTDVEEFEFYELSEYKYNSAHRLAPLLTLGLLCMRKVGPAMELAPPPEEYDLPRIHEAWRNSGLRENIRCVRNRNTGDAFVLQPPDVTPAEQVIGLDALPTKRFWDLIFATGSSFDHWKIISREDFSDFLSAALNMTVKQIGRGSNHYAGGRISDLDKYRFASIKAIEGKRFPLISTKKALAEYDSRGWIDPYVKPAPEDFEEEVIDKEGLALLNYAKVLSSNDFEKEDFGVVSGTPYPGHSVVRRWAGLCGGGVEVSNDNEGASFDGIAHEVYRHLTQHQIIQAILRYGRHKEVWSEDGSTVYVNSTELPEWFEPESELTIAGDDNSKKIPLIEFLITAKRADDSELFTEQNAPSIKENMEIDIDDSTISGLRKELHQEGVVSVSDKGRGVLFHWIGDDQLHEITGIRNKSHALVVGEKIYLLDI